VTRGLVRPGVLVVADGGAAMLRPPRRGYQRLGSMRSQGEAGAAPSLRIADLIFEAGSPRSVWFGPLVRTPIALPRRGSSSMTRIVRGIEHVEYGAAAGRRNEGVLDSRPRPL